jgi:hypothetical protein
MQKIIARYENKYRRDRIILPSYSWYFSGLPKRRRQNRTACGGLYEERSHILSGFL